MAFVSSLSYDKQILKVANGASPVIAIKIQKAKFIQAKKKLSLKNAQFMLAAKNLQSYS